MKEWKRKQDRVSTVTERGFLSDVPATELPIKAPSGEDLLQDQGCVRNKMPDINCFLKVGFNSTTRHLEELARRSASLKDEPGSGNPSVQLKTLAVVFIPSFEKPSIMYSHLPLLAKTASQASPSMSATRVVILPKGAEERLSAALAIPRVGLVGLLNEAPNAASMVEFIRYIVPDIAIPWFKEAAEGVYLPVAIKEVQKTASVEMPATHKRSSQRAGNK